MKRIKRRSVAVIVLVAMIAAGLGLYVFRYAAYGDKWVSFRSNGNAYSGGRLKTGTLTDRYGVVLAKITDGKRSYAEDKTIRKATLHAVGDKNGNIGTSALKTFAADLTGFDPVGGIYSLSGNGGAVALSIDANACAEAYKALDGRNGAVAVMDYKTGELICIVSTPTFDPEDPPEIAENDTSGVYLNRVLSSTYTPGSIFKLVTLAAAIENIDDLFERDFHCDGSTAVGGDRVVCTSAHGDMKIEDALAKSCNCVFANLALELGADTIAEYAEKFGLTSVQTVDGIGTASGKYEKADAGTISLAWSGVGQYNDMVNPAAMLRFVAAIANGGKAPEMTALKHSGNASYERIMKVSTAEKIADMMNYAVGHTYGEENFPGLKISAKSGTAEVGGDRQPNAWFVGFLDDVEHPYAFAVVIENGGWGSSAAGSVANKVLQACCRQGE